MNKPLLILIHNWLKNLADTMSKDPTVRSTKYVACVEWFRDTVEMILGEV